MINLIGDLKYFSKKLSKISEMLYKVLSLLSQLYIDAFAHSLIQYGITAWNRV